MLLLAEFLRIQKLTSLYYSVIFYDEKHLESTSTIMATAEDFCFALVLAYNSIHVEIYTLMLNSVKHERKYSTTFHHTLF